MVIVEFDHLFERIIKKLMDRPLELRLRKMIKKIIDNPEIGKPMMYSRKGTREVYVGSFRLSYFYIRNEGKIVFLSLYHKDSQ